LALSSFRGLLSSTAISSAVVQQGQDSIRVGHGASAKASSKSASTERNVRAPADLPLPCMAEQ
jgi:hypothetical protein